MTDNQIKARIAARKAAEQYAHNWKALLKELESLGANQRADLSEAMVDHLRKALPKRMGPKSAQHKAPSAARLAAHVMPFGKYDGKPFKVIPLDYLEWLCERLEELLPALQAYLKSKRSL